MYDHYIGLDWAQDIMAIARMTKYSEDISVSEGRASIRELCFFLRSLKGTKILVFEESTTAQWLYTEIKDYVDELVICDPFRNHLLKEGPKTDKIDAKKLVQLLKSNLLKPVFHSGDEFMALRKLVSGYEDLVRQGIRMKNQRSALFRSKGENHRDAVNLTCLREQFVLGGLDRQIELYEKEKNKYVAIFNKIGREYKTVRDLFSIPGIGIIGAVYIAAIVVDPKRFKSKGNFLSYCGLIKLEKMSGGRSYGKRMPRYCRRLKGVFKTSAMACIRHNNPETNALRKYYDSLIISKGCAEYQARHALARRIAVLSLGVMKSGRKINLKELECKHLIQN